VYNILKKASALAEQKFVHSWELFLIHFSSTIVDENMENKN